MFLTRLVESVGYARLRLSPYKVLASRVMVYYTLPRWKFQRPSGRGEACTEKHIHELGRWARCEQVDRSHFCTILAPVADLNGPLSADL